MFTYRRLVYTTTLIVVVAAAAIPCKALYCHWAAVSAFEGQTYDGTVILRNQEPPFGKWLSQKWYSKLFGTVGAAQFSDVNCTAQDMSHLRNLRGLTELDLMPDDEVTDDAWRLLPKQLTILKVHSLNDAGLQQIANLDRLEHLLAYSHGGADDRLLSALAKMTRLRSLLISEPLSPSALDTLLTHHPSLENLLLASPEASGIARVSQHPHLKWLSVTMKPPDYDRLKVLERLSTLKELCINRPIEQYDLEHYEMDQEVLAKFALSRPDLEVSFYPPAGPMVGPPLRPWPPRFPE